MNPQSQSSETGQERVSVETTVRAPAAMAWAAWTSPEHIKKWNAASDDWHCPEARIDLRPGGTFSYRMEAKDGSFGFDYAGKIDRVDNELGIWLTLDDGRKVSIEFTAADGAVRVLETFDLEASSPIELQRQGWQAILDRFAVYAEELVEASDARATKLDREEQR